MRPNNITSGAAFKSVAISQAIFILSLFIIGLLIFLLVKSAMYAELKAQVIEEIVLFNEIYEKNGRQALVESIAKLEKYQTEEPKLVGVFGEDSRKLAGNVDVAPDFVGWSRVRHETLSPEHDYFAYTSKFEETTIIVGRNLRLSDHVLASLLRVLLLGGVVVSIISLAIGYTSSRGVYFKLKNLAATLDRVSEGDTQVRLPISEADDQIDRISRLLNQHLDRLASLINSTRNTATSIAHDLRTPLNRAFLVLHQAREHASESEELAELIQQAENELVNVTQIFDTILRISKLESSTTRSSFSSIPVNGLLEEMVETYRPVVESAEQQLVYNEGDTAERTIYGDEKMLRQMLANLIENASLHCPPGTIIELNVETMHDGTAIVELSDNGPGIPDEFRDKVLEPFFRLDANRHTSGSGLGLSLVKAIAIRHGVSIDLSDNDPGLRVSIHFPPEPTSI